MPERGACLRGLPVFKLRDVHLHNLQFSRCHYLPEMSGREHRPSGTAKRLIFTRRHCGPPLPIQSIMHRTVRLYFVALVLCLPFVAGAQEKQRFANLDEALQAGAILNGRQGPRNVNWIEGGKRYSYTARAPKRTTPATRAHEPVSGKATTLFTTSGLTFPGTNQPFSYDSFQWAQDSKHLVFQSNFQPIYRRSGISDFYIYSLADRSLQLATKGARTGELSPNGAMLGFERDGDMYVTNLLTHQETKLTRDASEHIYNGHFDWVYEEEYGLAQAWKC